MSVARFPICHFAIIKYFIYSVRAERHRFYFLYEAVRTGMQVNGGEKWRQFQLIISSSDILMHYCYNYSKMSSKDHHISLFQISFFIEWKFNKQPFWLVLISEGAIPFYPSPFAESWATFSFEISGVSSYKGLLSFPYILTSFSFSFPWICLLPTPQWSL